MKQECKLWFNPSIFLSIILTFTISCNKKDNNGNSNNPTGTVTDIDGNLYRTVTIGSQVWMAENLKATKFNDGTPIQVVSDCTQWSNLNYAGYCWFNNDSTTNSNPYGALYNGYSVTTGKLSPTGWHIPSETEWYTLINFLGGEYFAGGKMKETGTTHWNSPNVGATNTSGFLAVPGGNRWPQGDFGLIGTISTWWSTTQISDSTYWICNADNSGEAIFHGTVNKKYGFSVRCVKN